MRGRWLLVSACLAMLEGCASMGGNVKGNFICRAPDGICSPTSNIDDQAIASMTGGEAAGAVARVVMPAAPQSAGSLKVVLPARTDRFGRWRDQTVVFVDPQLAAGSDDGRQLAASSAAAPPRLSLIELAAGAPAPAEIANASVSTPSKSVSGENFRAEVERRLAAGREGPGPVEVPPSDRAAAAADADQAVVSAPALAGQPAPDGM